MERERESEVGFAVWQAIQSREKEDKYNSSNSSEKRTQKLELIFKNQKQTASKHPACTTKNLQPVLNSQQTAS